MVKISVKIQDVSGIHSKEITMDIASLLEAISNGPQSSFVDQSITISRNPEHGISLSRNTDMDYYARRVRKLSGYLNTLQQPFAMAENRMTLYRKIPSSGGTTRIFPFEKRYPKWAGKYGGKLISPRLGTLGVDLSNSAILKASKYLKYGGRMIGGLDVVAGGIDIYHNGLNFSNGLHTTMAIVALIPGGQTIAGVYFIVDLAVTLTKGKDIGAHIEDTTNEVNSMKVLNDSTPVFIDSPIKLPNLPMHRNNLLNDVNQNCF